MIRTVLIIGGSGVIGTQLAQRLREGYKVFATYNDHPFNMRGVTTVPLRFANPSSAKQVLGLSSPDIIVFAAGSTIPEWVEKNQREAERVLTGGAGAVFSTSGGTPPRLIYLSSAYVFDGQRGNYRETDTVLPSLTIGRFKLSGENFVRTKSVNHIILRVSRIIGRGNGLRMTLLDELRMKLGRGERFSLPDNEIHSYVPVWSVVDTVAKLVESGPKNRTFHMGGLTKLNPFEFGQRFAKRFGYNPDLITPTASQLERKSSQDTSVKHYDFSLNSSQLIETLKVQPLLLEECFDLIEKKLVTGL